MHSNSFTWREVFTEDEKRSMHERFSVKVKKNQPTSPRDPPICDPRFWCPSRPSKGLTWARPQAINQIGSLIVYKHALNKYTKLWLTIFIHWKLIFVEPISVSLMLICRTCYWLALFEINLFETSINSLILWPKTEVLYISFFDTIEEVVYIYSQPFIHSFGFL